MHNKHKLDRHLWKSTICNMQKIMQHKIHYTKMIDIQGGPISPKHFAYQQKFITKKILFKNHVI